MKKKNDYTLEYKKYCEEDLDKEYHEQELLAHLLRVLLKLWFKPNEPLEDFSKWFWERMLKYNITSQQLENVIDNFYDYWSEANKDIKSYKSTFLNTPKLRPYLKSWYEIDTI